MHPFEHGGRSMCVAWEGEPLMPGTGTKNTKGHQRRWVLPFEALPTEVGLLRRAATTQLDQWGVPTVGDVAQLVVTELATNVIKHVGEGSPTTLILEWKKDRLRVEMHDKSRSLPSLRTADCDAECGRGLHMLATMAVDWGTTVTALGKAVWCEIPLGSDAVCLRMKRAIDALENYRECCGSFLRGRRDAGMEESAVELIADLLHWTSARGLDPVDMLERAQLHYEVEADAA